MAQSSNHQQRRSSRSRSNSNSNSNSNSSRSRNNRGTNSGGGSQRRFVKQKVPRRTRKPSLWEKICGFFSPSTKRPSPPQRSSENNSRSRSRSTPKKQPRVREPRNDKPQNAGPPEKVAVTSSRLYVGNLAYATTGDELASLFEKVGGVVKAEIVYHRRSNRSKGYAFVEMNDANDAKKAAETLHDQDFMGRQIIVNGAKSEGPQDNYSS